MMKRYLLSIVAVMLFSSGYAAAEPASPQFVDMGVAYGSCAIDQHCEAVVASHTAGPVMQLPSLNDYRSTVFRSDMRVASAGMVFNRTDDQILHWALSSA